MWWQRQSQFRRDSVLVKINHSPHLLFFRSLSLFLRNEIGDMDTVVIHRFAGLKISKNGQRVQAETVLGASYWKCHLGKESERKR